LRTPGRSRRSRRCLHGRRGRAAGAPGDRPAAAAVTCHIRARSHERHGRLTVTHGPSRAARCTRNNAHRIARPNDRSLKLRLPEHPASNPASPSGPGGTSPFARSTPPASTSADGRAGSFGQASGRRGRQVDGSVHTGSTAPTTSWSCQAGASDREGGNDDHCDCDDSGQGEGDVEGPGLPSAPGHVRRWAKPAGEAGWSGRRAVRQAPARLTLIRWMPSAVWALPPARRWTTPMPALPCIHPPVGASLVHRRTPNCSQRPSQARMAHPAQTQYAPAATHTGNTTRPKKIRVGASGLRAMTVQRPMPLWASELAPPASAASSGVGDPASAIRSK
jgi:hypothetical protein